MGWSERVWAAIETPRVWGVSLGQVSPVPVGTQAIERILWEKLYVIATVACVFLQENGSQASWLEYFVFTLYSHVPLCSPRAH